MPRVIYPTPVPAKISGCYLRSRSVTYVEVCKEKKAMKLHFRSIPTYMMTIPQRHGRRNWRT